MLELVQVGRVRPEALVRTTISLDDVPLALAQLDRPGSTAGITVALP
jgi:threonine dehydrogenase-like Zn-dependent dehydrogenase